MPLHCAAIRPKFVNVQCFFQIRWPVLTSFFRIEITIFIFIFFFRLLHQSSILVLTSSYWYLVVARAKLAIN